MSNIHAHLYICGTVQGVFFRASTQEQARERGVTGWVQNLEDGRVEAVLEGAREDVEAVLEWAHTGPARAEVTDVEVTREEPTGEFDDFAVRR